MKPTSMPFIAPIIALAMVCGCRDADPTAPGIRQPGSGTYIVNEGGFGGGASVSFFDPSMGSVTQNVVRTATPWLFPNDVLVRWGRLYIAVNGSDLVSIVDPASDSAVGGIAYPPGRGPGLLAEAGGRLYSANYDGTVSLIDTSGDSVRMTSARVVGFPGGIAAASGKVFVSDVGAWPDTGANVIVLDGSTLALLDSVSPGGGMAALVMAGGKLCAGATVTRKLYAIDPATLAISDSAELPASPGDLATDGRSLFALTSDAVLRIPLVSFDPDTLPLVSRSSGLYNYAMGFDRASGELYVSTVTTGGGSGEASVYTVSGTRIGSPFAVGIFPGAFGFFRP